MWTYSQKILRTFKTSNPSEKIKRADLHPSQIAKEHIKNYSTGKCKVKPYPDATSHFGNDNN